MGLYINPQEETKEAWLGRRGLEIEQPTGPAGGDSALVCWLDNGPFTAAAVVFDQRVYDDCIDPGDDRPKRWFIVPRVELPEVCGAWAGYHDKFADGF